MLLKSVTFKCVPMWGFCDPKNDFGRRKLNESLIRRMKPVPILVAGDVMVDEYIIGDVDRISPESPVPVLVARDRLRRLGGAGNVVRNLIAMGGNVALFATIGRDNPGRWFRNHCEQISVESFWLKEDPRRPTTIKTRVVARNQQLVRIDEEHVSDIPPELEASILQEMKSVMPQVKAVIISDYGKGFITAGILEGLISLAKAEGVPVLVDPKGMDFRRYRGVSYITPNKREAALAAGIDIKDRDSLHEAGRVLLDHSGAQGIIVTRGKDGSTLITGDKMMDFPVNPVEIVDVTGAGDTVIATLAMAVGNGIPVESAVSLANVAAGMVVSRFGAATVTLDEMIDSLNHGGPSNKAVSLNDISVALRFHRIQGKRICFTNGCFDLLHPGHLEILKQAAAKGDILVVGINSDKSVAKIKGKGRPIIPQADRVAMVSALAFVDYVVVFDEETPLNLIEEIKPDVLVKGADWKGKQVVGESVVKARGGSVEFVELVNGFSTTSLIDKIRNGHAG
jgi:D-beta-D-heptose 7-phosphate kinase / D-beta-D-heptose 1-phosphate adenosyltransferase